MASTPASTCALQEGDRDIGQRRHQRVPGLGLAEHHRLGAFVIAARTALDEVGRQRERGAGEADQRDVAELADQQPDGIGDGRHLLAAQGASCAATSAAVRIGCSMTGPTSGTMSRSMPDARSGTTMSENRMAASTPCLRTGCSVISVIRSGVEAGLHHGVLRAQLPVLGQRTSGLPHEPHRHPAGLTASCGGQIRRLGQLTTGIHRHPMLPCSPDRGPFGVRLRPIRRACAQTCPDGLPSSR